MLDARVAWFCYSITMAWASLLKSHWFDIAFIAFQGLTLLPRTAWYFRHLKFYTFYTPLFHEAYCVIWFQPVLTLLVTINETTVSIYISVTSLASDVRASVEIHLSPSPEIRVSGDFDILMAMGYHVVSIPPRNRRLVRARWYAWQL